MVNAISPNAKTILDFLIANQGNDFTAAQIAEALGFEKASVINTTITSGLIGRNNSRGLVERVEGPVVVENGKPKILKYIKVTPAGFAYDHDAALAADAADKEAAAAEKAARKAAKENQ